MFIFVIIIDQLFCSEYEQRHQRVISGELNASRADPASRAEHEERFTRLAPAVAKSAISGDADVRRCSVLLERNAFRQLAHRRRRNPSVKQHLS
jgi:hypothetical protein